MRRTGKRTEEKRGKGTGKKTGKGTGKRTGKKTVKRTGKRTGRIDEEEKRGEKNGLQGPFSLMIYRFLC